mgnify:CR=1 FL=1|tara:strand:+ start:4006 stop:5334 length:1329 start_codon:yes stop_codon:yes gene_type:complete
MTTCGDNCVFPVAKLSSESMQTCDQKCSYFGNYSKLSENNTIVNDAPYTMGKVMYRGKSDVIFNGISYSNTDDNNNIEISITLPLHTFDASANHGVGELIIMHQKNNTGVAPLWVCIPIVNSSIQGGSTGTRPGGAAIIEDMIDNLPGVPYIAKGQKDDSGGTKGNRILVRRGDNSTQGYSDFTFKTSSSSAHRHTDEQGGAKHRHYHVPGVGHAGADESEAAFMDAYTSGSTQISNQNTLGNSFKLNDVIPLAPYYFYTGVFNSTSGVTYDTCSNIDNIVLNVVVFDLKDGIPISSVYATKLQTIYETGSSTTGYPLLMSHNYKPIPDTYNNVSYHTNPFTNAEADDIYIDCSPVNFKNDDTKTTVLESTTTNNTLDAGSSVADVVLSFVNSSFFAIIIGVILMFIVYKTGRFLLKFVFGKQSMPNPGDMMGHTNNPSDSK